MVESVTLTETMLALLLGKAGPVLCPICGAVVESFCRRGGWELWPCGHFILDDEWTLTAERSAPNLLWNVTFHAEESRDDD